MPVEIAQVLYDLAAVLALSRCGARVIGLSDERYRKNVFWLLSQPWLDSRLRPVFSAAIEYLDSRANVLNPSRNRLVWHITQCGSRRNNRSATTSARRFPFVPASKWSSAAST